MAVASASVGVRPRLRAKPNTNMPKPSDAIDNDGDATDGAPRAPSPPRTAAPQELPPRQTINHDSTTKRSQIGIQLTKASDVINDNLIVVRYATISSVLLLGVYGAANTPLFYRYKSAWDIPTKMFTRRKWIHGRIVGVMGNERVGGSATRGSMQSAASSKSFKWNSPSSAREELGSILSFADTEIEDGHGNSASDNIQPEQRPIVLLFRHSSPIERLLTHSAMERVLSFTGKSPSQILYSSANPRRNLLPIELAGVVAPPTVGPIVGGNFNESNLVNELIQQKEKVSLQLLALRTSNKTYAINQSDSIDNQLLPVDEDKSTAICHLHYRKADQYFTTTNASLELVKRGQAWINSCGMAIPLANDTNVNEIGGTVEQDTTITDFNPTVKQLQSDTKFMSNLEEAEYACFVSKIGMWSSQRARALKKEYVEEEESMKNKLSTGLWNALTKGWNWIWGRKQRLPMDGRSGRPR